MIGRTEPFLQAQKVLEISQSGSLQVLFITGPLGIGKSTLVRELTQQTRSFYCVDYHYFESLASPYVPLIHALRAIHAEFGLSNLSLSLYPYLGLLLPELKSTPANADPPTLTDAIREVFCAVARKKPFLLVLEDCHWADAATLELLPLLMEGLTSQPITLMLTYRDDAVPRDHPLIKLRAHLRRQPLFSEAKLVPLTLTETTELITELLPHPPGHSFVELIYAQTQGLPFFVSELTLSLYQKGLLTASDNGLVLADNLAIPIPETIRDMVALQMDGITGPVRETLELAALLGQEFSLEVVSELASHDQAIDLLLASSLLVQKDEHTGAFSHALVREVIRQDIPWSKRKQLNRQIAAALEDQQAPPEQVGQYWLDAGDKTQARRAFARASYTYCGLYAHADSARTARRALDIWPKGTDEPQRLALLQQLAECARVSSQVHHSILALREMLESSLVQENDVTLADTYRALAVSYSLQGAWQHYKQCRRQAAELSEKAGLWAEASSDWHDLANSHLDDLSLALAFETARSAVACSVRTARTDLQAKSLSLQGYILAIKGKTAEGHQLAQDAVTLALANNHTEAYAYAYRKLAGVLEYSSDYNGSIQAYDTALNFCRRENLQQQVLFCLPCIGWVLFRMGEWKRALETCREYNDAFSVNDASRGAGLLIIGLIRVLRGETKTARTYVEEAQPLLIQANFHLVDPIFLWAMALVEEADKAPDRAYRQYSQLLRFWQKTNDVHDVLPGLCSAMAFFTEHDYRDECSQTVQILSTIANLTGNTESVATLSFALGEMALLQGNPVEASDHFAQASRSFGELSLPVQQIMALAKQGKATQTIGNIRAAADVLTKALLLAKPLAIRPLIAQITALSNHITENETAGKRLSDRPLTAGLTDRQIDVLHTLIDGLSNKEIASKLNLSTRTVDMHVRHIFDRLNCRSRAEAVRIALAVTTL